MILWDKGAGADDAVVRFSAGEEYRLDQRLVPYDCRASIAHARMLAAIGALTGAEAAGLIAGLETIIERHAAGEFTIRPEQEDCHTAIEEWLTGQVGEAGRKIHLGRSRNDQVLTALRLWQKDALADLRERLEGYRDTLIRRSEELADVAMPGYTHMRRAMPTTAGTWLDAFAEAAAEDRVAIEQAVAMIDASPLGTGAGYGVPVFELDRAMTARELGFGRVQENPIHAQMTRGKYEAAILAVLAQIMFGLNRLACDLLLFSTREFGFIVLPEALCTGSSMMPQKQNPDVLELIRGHYHVVLAAEFMVRNLIGDLMSGYQRDLGLTKAPLFAAFDETTACLDMMRRVVEELAVDEEACRRALTPELHATEEAYRLVREGLPFRDAYRRVGEKYSGTAGPADTAAPTEPDRDG